MPHKSEMLEPIHPGEMLAEEFMAPLNISINQLARDLHVPPNRISAIVNRKRGITADTALRLARYFGVSPEFWLNLQTSYELRGARRAAASEIEKHVHPRQAA